MCGPAKLSFRHEISTTKVAGDLPEGEFGAAVPDFGELLAFGGLAPLMAGKGEADLDRMADRLELFCEARKKK
jgi:hypothetical protein